MKKFFSYIFPFTRSIKSEHNGTLEITWINGKKLLDSANTNYSYGSLQRLLTYGLTKIQFENTDRFLVLGLGGGSVIETLLQKYKHQGLITAVEIDKRIIEIAAEEFNIQSNAQIVIHHEDALHYIATTNKTFDVIIVDLFIDKLVPEAFYNLPFWKNISEHLTINGRIIFNAGINLASDERLKILEAGLAPFFSFTRHTKVEIHNTLLIGKKLAR